MGWFEDMSDGLTSFIDDMLKGLNDSFATYWNETESCMEEWLQGFGENITAGAYAYKDLVVKEYKLGLTSIKNDYEKLYRQLKDRKDKIKDADKKKQIDSGVIDLMKRRDQKAKNLESKKEARLRRFEKAKERYKRKIAK